MIPIRQWREQRSLWHALVFCLWLGSFIFSFAASDCFHSSGCPERLRLEWSGHSTHAAIHSPTGQVANLDTDCPACDFQDIDAAILTVLVWIFPALAIASFAVVLIRVHAILLPLIPIARGPPASTAFLTFA